MEIDDNGRAVVLGQFGEAVFLLRLEKQIKKLVVIGVRMLEQQLFQSLQPEQFAGGIGSFTARAE